MAEKTLEQKPSAKRDSEDFKKRKRAMMAREEERLQRWRVALADTSRLEKIMAESMKGAENFQVDADDYVVDPRYAAPVSRFGKSKTPRKRELVKVMVQDPADPLRLIEADAPREGLVRLWKDGTISDEMFHAGAEFKKHFSIAGYDVIATVNLSGLGGGGKGLCDHIVNTTHSRKVVAEFLNALAWPRTEMSKAAWWILGCGMAIEHLAALDELHEFEGARDYRYWRGMLVSALQVMSLHYSQGKKKDAGRRRMNGQRGFHDDEMYAREGVIPQPNKKRR